MTAAGLTYRQVDVFADGPLAGNGLAVFITDKALDASLMQALTRELRQFESIFLSPSPEPNSYAARVFTMEEELPFAGHPAIGAAAVLHEQLGGQDYACTLLLPAGEISMTSRRAAQGYHVSMNQGPVSFGPEIDRGDAAPWLNAFGLEREHLDPRMPLCVASTGLPYLFIPVSSDGLTRARVAAPDLERQLARVGAKFAYVYDVGAREGRTWDNAGAVEDIATGSAAGPLAGLLVRHGLATLGERITVRQGRFAGRPSEMTVEIGTGAVVTLSGRVATVARGTFDAAVS